MVNPIKESHYSFVFDTPAFALACRSARKEMMLTQAVAASRIGVSQPMYANFETGARKPSSRSLISVCAFYKFNPESFLKMPTHQSPLGSTILDKQKEYGMTNNEMRKFLGLSSRRYNSLIAIGYVRTEDHLRICKLLNIPFEDSCIK